MKKGESDYVLGLDIGASSVGWALLETREATACGILRAGVRVFDAAATGVFETGRTEPPGQARRTARLMRRQTERRARRLRRLRRTLQEVRLMPEGETDQIIPALDNALMEKYRRSTDLSEDVRARLPDIFPYWLRAQALDRRLEPHEVGRALYHLGQRRGFLLTSNRRAPPKKDEKAGVVKKRISELRQRMEASKARTLGEYFSRLNPHDLRIRTHYTQRDMFIDEFERIWTAQALHHPETMTARLKRKVRLAIFHQRPLKSAKGLVGPCEFERGRRRAAHATLEAQRFRVLQQVNNTEIIDHVTGEVAPLTREQSRLLADGLQVQSEMSFGKARRLLGLSGKRHVFNLEEGGEKKFIGNRTNAALRGLFDKRWTEMTDAEHERVVQDVLSVRQDEVLERRAREVWKLPPESAKKLADEFSPEPGYLGLSRHAIRKLLPLMEEGLRYSAAVEKVYGFGQRGAALDLLPPVAIGLPHLRNPVVHRTLAELRKVVNALIREHGKPQYVRIELARDLKRTADQRKEAWKRNLENRKAREDAASRVLKETGNAHPSGRDIEKALLWDECGHTCPYTGNPINFSALFGTEPEFDVEHIVPFSRSLDDSFFNKTLCSVKENRQRKGNRTPWEAYGSDPTRWNEIIGRVQRFQGSARIEKLRRFQLRAVESLENFASQQMNDTRQASKEALRYLGLLYGGYSDAEHQRRIFGTKGGMTAYLRDVWNLNSILGDGGNKSRDDHRHHAVDAVAVALTEPGVVKALSDAAARASRERRRRFGDVPEPWAGFLADVRGAVERIVVSHRPERKLGGALHADTFYSKERAGLDGQLSRRVRRPLSALKRNGDVEAIVDPVVREAVRARLGAVGGDFKKLADSKEPPCLIARDGRRIPIRKVRVRENAKPVQIGKDVRARFALTSDNHHMVILEEQTKRGPRWKGLLVTRLEAVNRHSRNESVVRRAPGFVFSVASGDTLQLTDDRARSRLVVVRSVSEGKIEFVDARDARKTKDIKKDTQVARQNADAKKGGGWTTRSPEELRKLGCQKVAVSPTGQVVRAND